MAYHFRVLRVSGSHYKIGIQVGEALRDIIPRTIDQIFDCEVTFYKKSTKGGLSPISDFTRDDALKKTSDFLPLLEQYCPSLVEELRGISKGARISFEEALLLQIRGEVIYAIAGGCSAFVLSRIGTKDSEIITGQNLDCAVDLDLILVLHSTPQDGPAQLMLTFAGLTSGFGINAAGIGSFANGLPWHWCEVGIPHYPFKWRVLQQTDLVGIRRLCDETTTVQPGNYVFCDSSGDIADVELTPEGAVWLEDKEGFFVHTNHFLGEPFASRPDLPPLIEDSMPRYDRLYSLVKESWGKISVPLMQSFLSDHDNYPVSLCRHEEFPGLCTSASLIAEPERALLHVCAGNPCEGDYVAYYL